MTEDGTRDPRTPVAGLVVPGLPQPLLAPEQNEGWGRIRRAFEQAREDLRALEPDLLLVYSTMWSSVIGHQIQADPQPSWTLVDELFHDLGSVPYTLRIDADFAESYRRRAEARGLTARTVAYHGFPVDTGSVVALQLLNPDNAIPAGIVSSNVYANRAETIVLGKSAADAFAERGLRTVAVVVTALSNRLFTDFIDPADDRIHSAKDEEWNDKILEFLGDGRLEDLSQLSREIHQQIRVKKVVSFKPMWWLSAVMGQHNRFDGRVYDDAPIYGTGATVAMLTPSSRTKGEKEFDEDDVEVYTGDPNVIRRPDDETPQPVPPGSWPTEATGRADASGSGTAEAASTPAEPRREPPSEPPSASSSGEAVQTAEAPKPVGAYPHARRVGELLFISGMGPRHPVDDHIPGGPIRDPDGTPRDYDVAAQTHRVIDNVRGVLEASGASLEDVVDVTVFLVDMDRDFQAFNAVYKERLQGVRATRTTVAVQALPTPIAVEFKVVARPGTSG